MSEITSEYALYQSRGCKDYSVGHQKMYTGPIELLQNDKRKWRILDIGSGIGFGLRHMLDAGIVASYVGIEADRETYEYVSGQDWPGDVTIHHGDWLELSEAGLEPADHMFCIEVIEHIDEDLVPQFLAKARRLVKGNLFLSTPDVRQTAHGTATPEEWRRRLHAAGFANVAIVATQWTTLFVCD